MRYETETVPLHEATNGYLKASISDETLYNYGTALRLFCDWLIGCGIDDLRELDSTPAVPVDN